MHYFIWKLEFSQIFCPCFIVLVLIFWFRIIKCGWFCVLGIIARNFLKIGNGWAIVEKYATTVVYVENGKGIDESTENMSGITDDHQNYEKCECRVTIVIGA